MIRRPLASIALIALCAIASLTPANAETGTYGVSVESGRREAADGSRVDYVLYVPQANPELPQPPWPAVVLTHGFERDFSRHVLNAIYLAERGVIVLTPDMTSLSGTSASQLQNVSLTADHLLWLLHRSSDPKDLLFGLVDSKRLGLIGHSAGGAVSVEAAVDLQSKGVSIAALCLLDTVPWPRTIAAAKNLKPLALMSARSEPSRCNANGAVIGLLAQVPFEIYNLKIRSATHCDPESPTDIACMLLCGGGSARASATYTEVIYQFLRQALSLQVVEPHEETLHQALVRLSDEQRLEITSAPPF